jgi:hypothetical protein
MPELGALNAAWFLWSLPARPPQIVVPQTPFLGYGGLVSRLGVPTPARFDGEFSNRTTILRGTAKQSGSLQASGQSLRECGIVALELSSLGSEPGPTGGAWGQAAAASGEEFEQRGAPVRSAHCFRVSPDPGESWSTAMGSGRRHRQVQLQGGSCKARSRRSRATTHPGATVGGRRGVFPCGFPHLVRLHIPPRS